MIIDEALAVGDVYFQKKCIDRIMDFRKAGGTLLFCSHALYQVTRVSDRVIWIKNGEIWMDGDPEEVVAAYEWHLLERERRKAEASESPQRINANTLVKITEFSLENHAPLKRGSDLVFHIRTEAVSESVRYHLSVSIKAPTGWGIYVAATHFDGMEPLTGSRSVTLHFPRVPMIGGHYYAHARVFDDEGLMLYDEKRINGFQLEKVHGEIGSCYLEHVWKVR
jgi:lipopolysaccharide transport system ATP-binding protein